MARPNFVIMKGHLLFYSNVNNINNLFVCCQDSSIMTQHIHDCVVYIYTSDRDVRLITIQSNGTQPMRVYHYYD